jgi:hypothetical protein
MYCAAERDGRQEKADLCMALLQEELKKNQGTDSLLELEAVRKRQEVTEEEKGARRKEAEGAIAVYRSTLQRDDASIPSSKRE